MDTEYDDDFPEHETVDEEVATSLVDDIDERDKAAFYRPANEDDDGYDPYEDRREARPLFERDPWA